jgi:hypothetical protein
MKKSKEPKKEEMKEEYAEKPKHKHVAKSKKKK